MERPRAPGAAARFPQAHCSAFCPAGGAGVSVRPSKAFGTQLPSRFSQVFFWNQITCQSSAGLFHVFAVEN